MQYSRQQTEWKGLRCWRKEIDLAIVDVMMPRMDGVLP